MRTTTEVGERTVGIECDGTILEVADKLNLVLVTLLGEGLQCLSLRNLRANHRLLVTSEFGHLVFNLLQVSLGDCYGRIYVIVESVVDSRTDTELNTWVECLQGLCQQV